MDKLWTSCKQVINKSWTGHEQVINKSWTSQVITSHKQVINKSWSSFENITNKLWAISEQVINKLWATSCRLESFYYGWDYYGCRVSYGVGCMAVPHICENKGILAQLSWIRLSLGLGWALQHDTYNVVYHLYVLN